MVKASEAMSARARARQAKAELDAQRAEQDRLIVDAATEFYEAAEAAAAARAAAVAAEELRARSVARLLELGQTETQTATLCGIEVKEVRELRRRRTAQPKPKTPAKSPGVAPDTEDAAGTEPAEPAETTEAA